MLLLELCKKVLYNSMMMSMVCYRQGPAPFTCPKKTKKCFWVRDIFVKKKQENNSCEIEGKM